MEIVFGLLHFYLKHFSLLHCSSLCVYFSRKMQEIKMQQRAMSGPLPLHVFTSTGYRLRISAQVHAFANLMVGFWKSIEMGNSLRFDHDKKLILDKRREV